MRARERKRDIKPQFPPFSPSILTCSLHSPSRRHADVVAVSIYVNPTQFAAHEDFGVYPRTREADRAALAAAGVDAVFEPESLYERGHGSGSISTSSPSDAALVVGAAPPAPGSHETSVTVARLQVGLCGGSRPHFFSGVATVVAKLFNCVDPDLAVFGKKDFQQLAVITRMARDLDFGVRVIGAPIMREGDGLALSSRNALLTAGDRAAAPAVARALARARKAVAASDATKGLPAAEIAAGVSSRIASAADGVRVDYVSLVDAADLTPMATVGAHGGWGEVGSESSPPRPVLLAVAAFFGKVRLIDNTVLGAEADEGLAGLDAEAEEREVEAAA